MRACYNSSSTNNAKKRHLLLISRIAFFLLCHLFSCASAEKIIRPVGRENYNNNYPFSKIKSTTKTKSSMIEHKRKFDSNKNIYSNDHSQLLSIRGGGSFAPFNKNQIKEFLNIFDLCGMGFFAFTGALTGAQKGMDLLGVIILSAITSVGGGTTRCILLNTGIPFWIERAIYIKIIIVVSLATFYLWPMLEKNVGITDKDITICTTDAIGMAFFAVLGAQKAADLNLEPVVWVFSATLTACGGGVMRDIVLNNEPRIMYPHRSMYAMPPVFGSTVFAILTKSFNVPLERAACVSFLITFFIRVLSFRNPSVSLPYWKDPDLLVE